MRDIYLISNGERSWSDCRSLDQHFTLLPISGRTVEF